MKKSSQKKSISKKSVMTVALALAMTPFLLHCAEHAEPALSAFAVGTDRIVSRSYHKDLFEYHRMLEYFLHELNAGTMQADETAKRIEMIARATEETDNYYDYVVYPEQAGLPKDNSGYGANAGEDPIGGGKGYRETFRSGKISVKTAAQLVKALENAQSGDVIFIVNSAEIDMTDYMIVQKYVIRIKDGVTLAGDRGDGRSKGGILYTTALVNKPMIELEGNARITGLVVRGPDATERDGQNIKAGPGIACSQSGATIDNCEISGFGYAAIELKNSDGHIIKNCYIHHNRNSHSGYGIKAANAGALVEACLFNRNTVSVFGDGGKDCALTIKNNIEMGTSYRTCIEMGSVETDGRVYTGKALVVENNTFLTPTPPYSIQGVPQDALSVKKNLFGANPAEYGETNLYGKDKSFKRYVKDNRFGFLKKSRIEDDEYIMAYDSDMNRTGVLSGMFFGNPENSLGYLLEVQKALLEGEVITMEAIQKAVVNALVEIEQYDKYYDYIGKTFFSFEGDLYGAIPDDNPLGGGFGYSEIPAGGDYEVTNTEEFLAALAKATAGETVFVKGQSRIDLTAIKKPVVISDGVTLAGDRGRDNSPGALIFCDSGFTPLFHVGANVRVTGLMFRGADTDKREEHHAIAYYGPSAKGSDYYYRLTTQDCFVTVKDNFEVDNCELSGFSHTPIFIQGGNDHHIHHNFFHHNQREGLGYGICMDVSTAVIEYNLMNANRHDIAGTGRAASGYIARHNVQMGTSLSHCFDMHGGMNRLDGTDIAGQYVIIHNNMFLSEQLPYLVSGVPIDVMSFYNNAVYRPIGIYNREYLYGQYGATSEDQLVKFKVRNNLFGIRSGGILVE